MPEKGERTENEIEETINKLTLDLKKYDEASHSREEEAELRKVVDKLVLIGKPAVSEMIKVLNDPDSWSSHFAAEALGKIGDERAIAPLVDALEESELGEHAKDALKEIGEVCIPEVIKKIEYRIAHPIREGSGLDLITSGALSTIGEIRCDRSIEFLNRLLDEYMSELPDGPFDPTTYDWKYVNVDMFHLLDCMVRQQDKRAIPHIRDARDVFSEEYADYKICQIAIGRILKGRADEGYLPLEVLDIIAPAGAIMNALSGGELGWEDTFDEEYGEYFVDDDDWDEDWDMYDGKDHRDEFEQVYQFKITLKNIRPPIWRRIQVPENYTFRDLHVAIQDVMEWSGCHPHEFEVPDPKSTLKLIIGHPDDEFGRDILPEQKRKIAKHFSMESRSAEYLYDFGDCWEHKILLEKILPREEDVSYPVCLKGKRACPPEDCGGVGGYADILDALKDPDGEDSEELLDWINEEYDPEFFNAKYVVFSDPDDRSMFDSE